MGKLLVIFLITFLIFNINSISASCDKNQIDLNSASAEELTEIKYIGEVRAADIINSRPFETLNELIKISGIGNWTLEQIISEDLACVNGYEEDKKIDNKLDKTIRNEDIDEDSRQILEEEKPSIIEFETITLNPKVIKTEEDKTDLNKNYAIYGFVGFVFLLGILFLLRKNKYKNEFR